MSNSESFTKPEPAAPVPFIPYNENLETVLSAIPHKPNRDYLREAVHTMLAHGFTHITGEGWKPTSETKMLDVTQLKRAATALETLTGLGFTYAREVNDWISPISNHREGEPLSKDAARLILHATALDMDRAGKVAMARVIKQAVETAIPFDAAADATPERHDIRYAMAVAVLELDGYSWDADRVNWRKSIIPGIGEDHSLRVREHLLPHGVAAIMSERIRQIHVESYTVSDDLGYEDDELLGAALAYLGQHWYRNGTHGRPPQSWPWDAKFWKPVDRRRDLERAGALIAAELDRMNAVQDATGVSQ